MKAISQPSLQKRLAVAEKLGNIEAKVIGLLIEAEVEAESVNEQELAEAYRKARAIIRDTTSTEFALATRKQDHDCIAYAKPCFTDGPLGHGWKCGRCGSFLQAG
jgi:excinuclease UvrABC nuclease subunit